MSQFVDWCLMSLFENTESSHLHVASLPSLFYWSLKDTHLGTPGQASVLLSLRLHLPMGPTSTSFWDCVHICFKRCLSCQLMSETGREAEGVPVWLLNRFTGVFSFSLASPRYRGYNSSRFGTLSTFNSFNCLIICSGAIMKPHWACFQGYGHYNIVWYAAVWFLNKAQKIYWRW